MAIQYVIDGQQNDSAQKDEQQVITHITVYGYKRSAGTIKSPWEKGGGE